MADDLKADPVTGPNPAVMTAPPATATADADCERALAVLLADSAQAGRLAARALDAAAGDASRAGCAHAVLAIVGLREGEQAAARQHLTAARSSLAAAGEPPRLRGLVDHAQSLALRREGRMQEAEALLQGLHAQADARPAVDAYLSAAALGIMRTLRADIDGGLDLFYQALALARRSGEDHLLVNALNNLGSYQSDLFNLEDAHPMLEECLQGALRLDSRRQIIFAAGNLVQCLCLMGEPVQALAVAREHLLPRLRPDDPPVLQRDDEVAMALLANGLLDEAEARLARAAPLDPLANETIVSRYWIQARVRLARGDAAGALALCLNRHASLPLQQQEGTAASDRVILLRVAAEAAGALGDHAQAYQLLTQAFETHERLLGRAARARRISVQISHRLQQAEWERDAARKIAHSLEVLNTSLQAQVSENDRLQQRLRAQALEDPLTGLPNRRHLFEAGPALLAMSARRGEALAAALVDLDHFKQVNDRHGHDAGDRVLRAFAEAAREHLRAGDIVCRYGGEEFVLVFPGASATQAAARVSELLARFAARSFVGAEGAAFHCSFSAGVAAWQGAQDRLEDVLARADESLYGAKAAGRARVCA